MGNHWLLCYAGVGGCHWVAPSPVVVLDAGEPLALVLRSVGLNVV